MHREILTKPAAPLFTSLSRFSGFYLAGGTALALQIGHRVSVDFDLFSDAEIKRSLLPSLRTAFPGATIAPLVNNADELTALVDDVKAAFLRYPFPTINPLVLAEGVLMLSVREIAATKAYPIGRRGAFKDYVDLYFSLLEGHTTLTEIIGMADKQFGVEFKSRLFLEHLVFLDDIDDTEIDFLKPAVTRAEILRFFESAVVAYAGNF
jgi:hypothetical protein